MGKALMIGLLLGGLLLAGCTTPVSPARQVWCDHNQARRPSALVVAAMSRPELDEVNAYNGKGRQMVRVEAVMIQEFLDALGIKAPVVVAGLSGGILRALSRHRYKVREMVASPICGALAAAYLTLPVVHYIRAGLPVPSPDDDTTTLAAAFLIGVSAMWISDIVFEVVVRRFKPEKEE